MLTRFWNWLFNGHDPDKPESKVDTLAIEVARRQRIVANRLSAVTGKTPEELLDYRRADSILRGSPSDDR